MKFSSALALLILANPALAASLQTCLNEARNPTYKQAKEAAEKVGGSIENLKNKVGEHVGYIPVRKGYSDADPKAALLGLYLCGEIGYLQLNDDSGRIENWISPEGKSRTVNGIGQNKMNATLTAKTIIDDAGGILIEATLKATKVDGPTVGGRFRVRFNPSDRGDLIWGKKTKAVIESIEEYVEVHNGSVSSGLYDVNTFTMQKALRNLARGMKSEEDSCTYESVVGRREAIALIRSESIGDDSVAEKLKELYDQGLLKTAVTRMHADGERESCSLYRVNVYTTDGNYLSIDYDFTT